MHKQTEMHTYTYVHNHTIELYSAALQQEMFGLAYFKFTCHMCSRCGSERKRKPSWYAAEQMAWSKLYCRHISAPQAQPPPNCCFGYDSKMPCLNNLCRSWAAETWTDLQRNISAFCPSSSFTFWFLFGLCFLRGSAICIFFTAESNSCTQKPLGSSQMFTEPRNYHGWKRLPRSSCETIL